LRAAPPRVPVVEAMQRVIDTMVGERTERQLKDKLVLRLSGGSGVVDTPLMDEL